jgi:outer membrane protein OmpA-like peptidoglycan-associated protein
MRHSLGFFVGAALLTAPLDAGAEELRLHATGGAAHAVGSRQQREFGAGGGGSATVELPVAPVVGVQAGIGGLVLARGKEPADPSFAPQGAGTALTGTAGAGVRPLATRGPAGPWIDANGGVARTGNEARPMFDTHLGWDFRVSKSSRTDVGPFVGYTQILDPAAALSSGDARIAWVGLQVSLGAPERRRPAPPLTEEPGPPMPSVEPLRAQKGPEPEPEAISASAAADTTDPGVQLIADRIVLDDVVHFEFGSARITPQSYPAVKRIADFLNRNDDLLEISIEGHADAIGTEMYNQVLSEARAMTMRWLLARFGVDKSRLHVEGFGKSHLKIASALPLVDNRRVELVVTRVRKAGGSPLSFDVHGGAR